MSTFFALAAALLTVAPPPAPAAPRDAIEVGVATALDKLRPEDAAPPRRSIALAAARGECEAAQVAARSTHALAALSASAAPLEGPERIPVALYRVAYIPLSRPSGPDGAIGEWPDPLVPERDADFGEARRAFPVAVPAGRLQAVWVEVCVPRPALAGHYRGQVVLSERGRALARVPLELEVWPFALPATSTFATAFGLSTLLGTRVLGAPGDPALARALAATALRNRVTPFGLSMSPPNGHCDGSRCDLDFSTYDAEMAPILDGSLVPGVRGTFAEVRVPAAVWKGPDTTAIAYLRAWRRHFDEHGWSDRLWLYTVDEPKPGQMAEVARQARAAHAAGVRVLATTVPHPSIDGLVDIYVPNVVFFDARGARPFTTHGRPPFWYVSCMSHGCGELPAFGPGRRAAERDLVAWPGYEIDRPGAAARVMGWLAFREGVAGELYYDMLQRWQGDPWNNPRAFAGNGDGILLYPGRPASLGGNHPFPVESIRLKLIRDGLEDYELLALAARSGQRALAERLAVRIAPSLRGFERRPDAYVAARRELGEALARALAHR